MTNTILGTIFSIMLVLFLLILCVSYPAGIPFFVVIGVIGCKAMYIE